MDINWIDFFYLSMYSINLTDHPTVNDRMVIRKVCFTFIGDCCKWSTSIRVKNCSGFYVYEFQKPPSCNLRYCGQGTTWYFYIIGAIFCFTVWLCMFARKTIAIHHVT